LRQTVPPNSPASYSTGPGHDLPSLLYNLLDEFLYQFSTEFTIVKEVEITELDLAAFRIKAVGRGETFDLDKHPQGTEVKAITYSNMQLCTDAVAPSADDAGEGSGGSVRPPVTAGRHEAWVIVDI